MFPFPCSCDSNSGKQFDEQLSLLENSSLDGEYPHLIAIERHEKVRHRAKIVQTAEPKK